jgi:hypothetical protein
LYYVVLHCAALTLSEGVKGAYLHDAVFYSAPVAIPGYVVREFSQAAVLKYAALTHSGCVAEELLGDTFLHCVALPLSGH